MKGGRLLQILMKYEESLGNTLISYHSTKPGKSRRQGYFLAINDLPKLNQENINNLNKSITINKIETGLRSLPSKIGYETRPVNFTLYKNHLQMDQTSYCMI